MSTRENIRLIARTPSLIIYTLGKKLGNTLISFKLFSLWQNNMFLIYLYVIIIIDCHTCTNNKVSQGMLPDSKQQGHCMI